MSAYWVRCIRAVLSPDLLKPEFRKTWSPDNPAKGHCYVASEALYHILGGKVSGWKPTHARDSHGVTHWWLEKNGRRLDPTGDQYVDEDPPYAAGRHGAFLTKEPSKRARVVLKRLGVEL